MGSQDDLIFDSDGELLVHEDSIQNTVMTQNELAILEASKEAARFVEDLKEEVTPNRVALAGVILLLFIGAVLAVGTGLYLETR